MDEQKDLFAGFTQCAFCGTLVHQEDAETHDYWNGKKWVEDHYCPEPESGMSCQQRDYLLRLKTAGS